MVVFNRLIYLFAFISLSSYVSAQEHSDFKTNEKLRDLYIERVSEQNASFATTYVGEYKSKFQTLYRKRSKDAKYYAENDVYLFEPSSLEYLNTLKNKIAVANQQFDFSGVNLVIAKFPWANAYSTGDGTIAVIPDIVTFYDNEDQLTYLLCHEFAHYFSRHFERQITKTYDYIESDEFKDRVKEINRMEYGKNTSAVALLNDNLYSQRSHSRRYEREADSLGLVLYLNASLCATESVNEVRKLGEMSEEFDKSSVLIFDRLGLPKSAGEPNEMMNIHDAERESKWDLVKSHPDVEQREEWILEEVERRQEEICETAPTDEFLKFKMQMEFESCNILVEYDMVDAALIKSERLRIKYPNSEYLKAISGYCMYQLYFGRKHHELFNYSRMPSENIKDPDLLNVLNSFYFSRLPKLRVAVYDFLKSSYTINQRDGRFLVSYARMMNDMGIEDKGTMTKLKKRYQQFYPNGKFAKYFPYSTKHVNN